MILILAPPEDEHARAVVRWFEEWGEPHARLELMSLFAEGRYAIDPLSPGFGRDQPFLSLALGGAPGDGAQGGPARPRAIYWRRPLARERILDASFPDERSIQAAEAAHAAAAALEALPESLFPMGHPAGQRAADNKLRQLRVARDLGFDVPETVVSNDPAILRAFLARHAQVVVKPLRHNVVRDAVDRSKILSSLYCKGIDSSALAARLEGRERAQLLVQAAVSKTRDWRITVLPHTLFACEIDTSALPEDDPDWRKKTMALPHRDIELPAGMEERLRAFLRALDLRAGYFDFGIDARDRPHFFECNTNAQWLWVEQLTGAPISREIARCLTGRV